MILPDVITPRLAGVALELEAGDVAVLSSSVFHTSRPNTSARRLAQAVVIWCAK